MARPPSQVLSIQFDRRPCYDWVIAGYIVLYLRPASQSTSTLRSWNSRVSCHEIPEPFTNPDNVHARQQYGTKSRGFAVWCRSVHTKYQSSIRTSCWAYLLRHGLIASTAWPMILLIQQKCHHFLKRPISIIFTRNSEKNLVCWATSLLQVFNWYVHSLRFSHFLNEDFRIIGQALNPF